MGTGKPMSSPMKFSTSVLRSAMGKSRIFIMNSKFFQPTHLLPQMPLNRLYFWKAITRPVMGL